MPCNVVSARPERPATHEIGTFHGCIQDSVRQGRRPRLGGLHARPGRPQGAGIDPARRQRKATGRRQDHRAQRLAQRNAGHDSSECLSRDSETGCANSYQGRGQRQHIGYVRGQACSGKQQVT